MMYGNAIGTAVPFVFDAVVKPAYTHRPSSDGSAIISVIISLIFIVNHHGGTHTLQYMVERGKYLLRMCDCYKLHHSV